ncbi:MAG: ABC transporter ATP-binding protein [Bacteroidetes bacterium]|nr:ABC transporter ATP-binding protein [Bacteroidota bacterium]MDA0874941.1 ABC transporter ATP-binding protein [Bacteroidota bacterium]
MHPLRRLNTYYWRYRRLFIPGLLCAVASAVFSIIVPMVVRQAIDSVPRFVATYRAFQGTQLESFVYADAFATLAVFGTIILLLSLGSGLFSFLMRQTIVVASRHIEFDLRNQLYGKLQALSHDFYLKHATGDLITRSTSDIEHVRRYIGPAIMYTTRALVVILTALSVMFWISPKLTWYTLIPMPFLAVSVFFVARMVHVRSDELQQQYSSLTSRVQEALSGIRVLKAYVREESEAVAFDAESSDYRARSLKLAMVEAAWRPVFVTLVGASTLIVVWVGGSLTMTGEITIGNIAEYIIYVALMTWPVAAVGFVITMIQRASASMIRLNEVFDAQPSIPFEPHTEYTPAIEGRITFRNACFRHADREEKALDDISFDVPAGSTLAIVGRTGSGKTTLVEMIPRLLDVQEGVVEIDGKDIREWPLETVRTAIGYVPQDVFLFSDTVAANIAFGQMEAAVAEVEEAAREADLLENIVDFREGFETMVGERGITLSGGQKQRTSIARALIRRPRILILDDALSAVDVNTERTILGHLRSHFGQRTVIIVSHRVSAVQDADQIIVLDEGRIIERGTHAELVERKGFYAALHHKQQLEQEVEAFH